MKRLRKGDFIKHREFKDVCLEVTDVFDYGHGVKVRGAWWTMGFVQSFKIGFGFERYNLNLKKNPNDPSPAKKSFIGDWLYLASSVPPQCLRYGYWAEVKPHADSKRS